MRGTYGNACRILSRKGTDLFYHITMQYQQTRKEINGRSVITRLDFSDVHGKIQIANVMREIRTMIDLDYFPITVKINGSRRDYATYAELESLYTGMSISFDVFSQIDTASITHVQELVS